jgi:hypothetical protein
VEPEAPRSRESRLAAGGVLTHTYDRGLPPTASRCDHGPMRWLAENKEWLFQGAAVAIPIALLGWLLGGPIRKRAGEQRQEQRGGDGSMNVQAGRDLTIQHRRDE